MNCKHGLTQEHCGMCNPSSKDIGFSLTAFSQRHRDLSSKELADKALEKMTENQRLRLLLSMLKNQFDNIKRGAVRQIEIEASPYERERRERLKETRQESAELRRSNNDYYARKPWGALYGKAKEEWEALHPSFRKRRLESNEPAYARFLEKNGHTDYLYNYCSYTTERLFTEFEENVRKKVTLELTEELLAASFVVDKRTVTWGEATVADHETRVKVLLMQASGMVDTAKRHQAAIILITDRKLKKLNEVVDARAKKRMTSIKAA